MAEELDPSLVKAACDKLVNDAINGDRRIELALKLIALLRSAVTADVCVRLPTGTRHLHEEVERVLPFIRGDKPLGEMWMMHDG